MDIKRDLRLRKSSDFKRVYGASAVRRGQLLVLHARPNETGHARIGISVSAKIGGAVQRNRLKRRLREALREVLTMESPPLDVVVVARAAAAQASPDNLVAELRQLYGTISTSHPANQDLRGPRPC